MILRFKNFIVEFKKVKNMNKFFKDLEKILKKHSSDYKDVYYDFELE